MALHTACEAMAEVSDISCECTEIDDDEKQELIDQASDIIAILTGGKITGRCTTTIRPCSDSACGHGRGCWCCDLDAIVLMGPDPTVSAVKVDGVTLTANDDYQVVNGNQLVRSRPGWWPGSQNPLTPDTEKGTFSITYSYGFTPLLAKEAVVEIVCDFIQSRPGQNTRKNVSPAVRSMTVAGVNLGLEQPMEELKRRMFLLPKVIRLLAVYAPDGPTAATVYSPELDGGWTLHQTS